MDFSFDHSDIITSGSDTNDLIAGSNGLLDKNFLTTAGVLVAAGGGVAGTALLLTALPGQVISAAALSGGLIYAGDRQAKGLPIVPTFKSEGSDTTAPAPAVAAAPASA